MFRCKAFGHYIIQSMYEDGSVVVKDLGYSKAFVVKSKEKKILLFIDKASEIAHLWCSQSLKLWSQAHDFKLALRRRQPTVW